jgi:hypothetical protein
VVVFVLAKNESIVILTEGVRSNMMPPVPFVEVQGPAGVADVIKFVFAPPAETDFAKKVSVVDITGVVNVFPVSKYVPDLLYQYIIFGAVVDAFRTAFPVPHMVSCTTVGRGGRTNESTKALIVFEALSTIVTEIYPF